MRRSAIWFLVTGLFAGILTVWIGVQVIAVTVGGIFSLAIVATMAATGTLAHLRTKMERLVAAVVLCFATFPLALAGFVAVVNSAQALGVPRSSDIVDFKGDVWLGLVAAFTIVSACGTLGVAIFTRRWDGLLFLSLLAAGMATVVVTYFVNLSFHNYWSFVGVLFSIDEAFCSLFIGMQLVRIGRADGVNAPLEYEARKMGEKESGQKHDPEGVAQ